MGGDRTVSQETKEETGAVMQQKMRVSIHISNRRTEPSARMPFQAGVSRTRS